MNAFRTLVASFAIIATAGCTGAAPMRTQGAIATPGFQDQVLSIHNAARAEAGLPGLMWNAMLASQAADYAAELASSGRFEHAAFDDRFGNGENLWRGTRGRFPVSFMLGTFVEEKRYFRKGQFPDVSTTGNWMDVGHYTQIIWPATTEVGCAMASNASDDYLVCRYAPTGNVNGIVVG